MLDARLFKEKFEEAQRIVEQHRNLPSDDSSEEDEENESDDNSEEEDDEEEVVPRAKEDGTSNGISAESDIIEKLTELKVESVSGKAD